MKISLSKQILFLFGLLLIILLAGGIRLDSNPPVFWDEGWTLNVARNWITLGHYGQLNDGQPIGPGLSAAFPVVVPVALSFRLFDVGVWQGRLPSVLYLFASLGLLIFLAERLYNRTIAIGTLVLLIFISGSVALHPLNSGRTVIGEMPMLFFLLSGYSLLFLALRKSKWFILPAGLLWGLAIETKAQTLPFYLVSLTIPLLVTIWKRWWQQSLLLLSLIHI